MASKDDYSNFKKYNPSSSEINLYYKLEKYIPNAKQFEKINLNAYEHEFGSNVNKDKFDGYITVLKSLTFKEFKKLISEKTKFPVDTMVGFGIWDGEVSDDNGKVWINVKRIDINDDNLISNSVYNSPIFTKRYIYIYIDKNRNNVFSGINENQIKNDKKFEKLEAEEKVNQNEINKLKQNINQLQSKNDSNQRKLSELMKENRNLTEKQEEQQQRKTERKIAKNKCNDEFNKEKDDIKIKKIEEFKKEINKSLIKDYINEFEKDEKEKNMSTKSLIKSFENFTNEFMKQCDNYNISFQQNSKETIEQYDTKNNKISIEHINFIVIGPAGVGKSAFINSSLLLSGDKKAREGKGESITSESHLYISEKLTMIRMWDTQGVDYKRNPEVILNEIRNLVNNGLKNGPDSYINIILYCTNVAGNRFQEEEGKLIRRIMELYPSDNLPVIITQLQAYFPEDAKEMENSIREILAKYLEEHIVKKIEIKSVVSRKKESRGSVIEAFGIPELLKCSFDKMGQAITSATSKKFSEEIEGMCEKFVENKLNFINKIFKDESELLGCSESLVDFDEDEEEGEGLNQPKNNNREIILPENDFYISPFYDFEKNFIPILNEKFQRVYLNLNGKNEKQEKPYLFTYIEEILNKIKELIQKFSIQRFEKIYKNKFRDYFYELQISQSELNKKYNTNIQINGVSGIEHEFQKELFDYFNNEFFKIYLCILAKLFKRNLQKILETNFRRIIKENEKSIAQKAEAALKNVTERLKEKLLEELEMYYPKKNEVNRILPNPSELNSENVRDENDDFNFSF